jgi:carbon-monoxide dehydrogenase large subunit
VEDPRFITGHGRYVADLKREGMLHAAFVRSYHGHARVTGISVEAARGMPGVAAVYSGLDLPEILAPLPVTFPQANAQVRMPFPLETEEVRHSGEAVAVVFAESQYQAVDAAEAVEVDYEPLSCVVDTREAGAGGAALVHSDVPGNVAGRLKRGFGDAQGAFERAPVVVTLELEADRAAGAAIEPRTIMVEPGDGEILLTVWDSTQAPFTIQRTVAGALGLSVDQVRVVAPDVGGAFGPKGRLYPEEIVLAAACRRLSIPVVWEATRSEDFSTTYQGRGLRAEAELAAELDGTILGLRVKLIQDCGAYLPTGFVVTQNSAQHLLGPYRIPACEVTIECLYTNKAPLTPLRGGGRELGVFVIERLLDRLAKDIGVDRCAVREVNLLTPGEFPHDTQYPSRAGATVVYDSGDYPKSLRLAKEMIGYDAIHLKQVEERDRRVCTGVAVTMFLESTGLDRETARASVGPDGRVVLTLGSPANGQGHATVMAQVCASILGVDAGEVDYVSGDTGAIGQGTGTFGSRMAVMAGNATREATTALRAQLLEAAADEIEADVHDLTLSEGFIGVVGSPERGMSLQELAQRLIEKGDQDLLSCERVFSPERPTTFAGGAHAAIVNVDPETGMVRVERYVVVHDCGTMINPTIVEGQIHGGVAHGLGNVMGERTAYDTDGQLLNGSFQSYAMPQAGSMPPIEIEHLPSPSPYNPLGIKGAGEGGTIGALATIVAAVEDALGPVGVTIDALPLDFEGIWESIHSSRH